MKKHFFYDGLRSGAHHQEPSSPIQTLSDNLCAYLFIFRNPRGEGGGGCFACTNPTANQNKVIVLRHALSQKCRKAWIVHQVKTTCFRGKFELPWGKDCSKNKKIRAKVDSRIYGKWGLLVMGSCSR